MRRPDRSSSRRSGPLRRAAAPIAFGAASLAMAPTADAADCVPQNGLSACVDAQGFWARPGAGHLLTVGPGTTLPDGQAGFGMLVTYMSRPIGLRVGSADPEGLVTYLVDDAVDATYWAAIGVTDRLELSVAAPVTFFQSGAGLGAVLGSGEQLPRSVVRDPRIGLAYALIARPRAGDEDGPSLVARGEMAPPLGHAEGFARSRTATFAPSVAGELREGILSLGAELGARIRGSSPFADVAWGTQVGGAAGASVLVWSDARMRVGAEAFTFVDTSDQPRGEPLMPAEWNLHVSSAPLLGGDVGFVLGGGGPLPWTGEAPLGTPRVRVELGVRYAPTGRDADGDGVLDRDDACPAELEDRDGFEDQDGCPDPDNDGDRIPDARDRCRDQAETVDGFEDEDGCPDPDDDRDGVPDELDRCRNQAEDRDGVADDDGCPEDDDDGDGVPDATDKCPRGAEDVDGFRDQDGCPDPDNDADGIADERDACPDAAEDKDGFEDEDGCPDLDNDLDGVLDGQDKCPTEAETIDGRDDDDGCPEAGATTRPRMVGAQVVLDGLSRFDRGSDAPSAALTRDLSMMAQLLRARGPMQVVIVEAWPDDPKDRSAKGQALAARRADAARAILAGAGIPRDVITAAAGDPGDQRGRAAPQLSITAQPASPSPRGSSRTPPGGSP